MPFWEEAGQDDLGHFSFPICATATKTDLAPGIQFAEIKLCSIYHLKASIDLDFFTVHQGFCRGAAGAAVLLGVALLVQKAEKMLCALPSLAAIKLFLKYLFPCRPGSAKLNIHTVKGSINYMSPLGRKRPSPKT